MFIKICKTFILLFISSFTYGQTCKCSKEPALNEIISCKIIKFDNNAKLYWSFNCDSSWLTFVNHAKHKKIIFSHELVDLTGRIGFSFITEYKKAFLIQNRVISGCCNPPEYFLFDKYSGQKKNALGRVLFYSKTKENAYIVSLTNSNYKYSYKSKTGLSYNSISIYNVNSNKRYFIKLRIGEIEQSLISNDQMYPEYLFDEPILNKNKLKLTYLLNKGDKIVKKKSKTIIINFNNY